MRTNWCRLTIWDEMVLPGRLVASNHEYIENTIPRIRSLLCQDLSELLNCAEVVVIDSRGIKRDQLQSCRDTSARAFCG
jgi:hypothetical protein